MNKGNNPRRSRGRGNGKKQSRGGGHIDSHGPEVRVRGNAHQVYDKYLALARDAASSGDRISAENYSQHAEHYFRLIAVAEANNEAEAVDTEEAIAVVPEEAAAAKASTARLGATKVRQTNKHSVPFSANPAAADSPLLPTSVAGSTRLQGNQSRQAASRCRKLSPQVCNNRSRSRA